MTSSSRLSLAFLLNALVVVAFFVCVEFVYIYHSHLQQNSHIVKINAGFFPAIAVLVLGLVLISLALLFSDLRASLLPMTAGRVGLLLSGVAVVCGPLFFDFINESRNDNGFFETGSGWTAHYQVFFPNGADQPYQTELQSLTQMLKPLRGCAAAHLVISGYASSAKFPPPNSDELNTELAYNRALKVKSALEALQIRSEATVWHEPNEMILGRQHLDVDQTGALQLVNRRVDIIVLGGELCSSEPQAR